VAAELDVDHLLEGAVFKAGKEVRISAQLIEAASDRHVWAESYRGSFANLLELQDKIARSVVGQVIDKLSAGDDKAVIPEMNPEAREACMMGDYLLRRSQTDEEINKAKDYYLAAIDKNPSCAAAYAGLAFTYFSLGGYGKDVSPSKEIRDKVLMYIQQALQIDPNNVRAHMVLGGLRLEWDWDWAGAEREFQEVLRFDPNHIDTLNWYSFLKMAFCQFDEQLTLLQKAYRLDPINLVTLIHFHRYYCAVFQYRRSLQILDRIDELYPGRCVIAAYRAWVYLLMGQYKTVITRGEALSDPRIYNMFRGWLVYAYGKSGQKDKALQMIADMEDQYRKNDGSVQASTIALACHGVGQEEEALQWLEQAHQDRDVYLAQLAHRTPWGELHWNPRFQDILRRIGVPVHVIRKPTI
jgi:tetratricopeptide (TPR) repeat protein